MSKIKIIIKSSDMTDSKTDEWMYGRKEGEADILYESVNIKQK